MREPLSLAKWSKAEETPRKGKAKPVERVDPFCAEPMPSLQTRAAYYRVGSFTRRQFGCRVLVADLLFVLPDFIEGGFNSLFESSLSIDTIELLEKGNERSANKSDLVTIMRTTTREKAFKNIAGVTEYTRSKG